MEKFVSVLGNPETTYPVIHITGTNGKGSTARMITRLLMAQGLTVGTYLSPHLERYNERIRLDDIDISDEDFAELFARLEPFERLLDQPPSHFELLTAAGFTYFADLAVDVAVVEVGLLGRYDATNVCEATVAVITNIGRDHSDYQGDWRERIAREKAGIIKASSHLILGEAAPALRPIFLAEKPAAHWVRRADFGCDSNQLAVGGRILDVRTPLHTLQDVFVPLHGAHQGDNAAVAIAAVEAFFGRPLDAEVVADALFNVAVPGRFEVMRRNPLVILDGAHNPDGAEAAGSVLAEEFAVQGRRILVIGVLSDRDVAAMLRGLGVETFDRVICCTPPSPRAVSGEELALVVASLGVAAEVAPSIPDALRRARAGAGVEDLIFVSGSLYLVGMVRNLLH